MKFIGSPTIWPAGGLASSFAIIRPTEMLDVRPGDVDDPDAKSSASTSVLAPFAHQVQTTYRATYATGPDLRVANA